jgi:hypothetical protein
MLNLCLGFLSWRSIPRQLAYETIANSEESGISDDLSCRLA